MAQYPQRDGGSFSLTGLTGLLNQSGTARSYFDSLPGYAQEMIRQRSQSVQTEDELHRFAENLLAGDK